MQVIFLDEYLGTTSKYAVEFVVAVAFMVDFMFNIFVWICMY